MIKATLRGLLQRKLRLGLAVFAIVLSVMFLAGVMVFTDTLNDRFTSMIATANKNIAVRVDMKEDAKEPKYLRQADIDILSGLDGAKHAEGRVEEMNVLPFRKSDDKAASSGAPSIGIGVTGDKDEFGLVSLKEGNWPRAADEITISRHTAKVAEVALGDQLKVWIPDQQQKKAFKVVGIVVYTGDRDSLGGENLLLFERTEAQRLFYGEAGLFGGAYLSAKDGVTQEQLRQRVDKAIPTEFVAKTGEEATKEDASEAAGLFDFLRDYILFPFVALSVLVGVFLIYNTFNIVVAQRSKELALLRALGAGWGQVTWAVLLEALIVGTVGATLGLLCGIGLAAGGVAALSSMADLQLPDTGLSIGVLTIVLAYLVGVGVTVIAAFVPAIKAALVPPVAAMRDSVKPDKSLKGLSITGGSLAVVGVGLVAWALSGAGSATFPLLLGGVVFLFFGATFLSPLLSKPVVRLFGLIIGRGQAGKLGVRNTLRNPRRTAVTAAALMIGVTVISLFAVVASSFKSTIAGVTESDLGAQVIISASQFSEPGTTGFDEKAVEKVRALPEVTEVAGQYGSVATVGGVANFVTAWDLERMQKMLPYKPKTGEFRTLKANEMVTDENTANGFGWKVGDEIKIELPKGEGSYRLIGIVETSPVTTGIIVGLPAVEDFAGQLAMGGFVQVREGADTKAVIKAIDQIMVDYPLVTVIDQSEYIKQSTAIFDVMLLIVSVLLGLALAIAVLGILNTLLLSIVERTRELGLVRAVGLSRGGLVRMVGVESILIAIFGCLLGLALGTGLGSAIVSALIDLKFLTEVTLPWGNLIGYFVGAIIAGIGAAVIPAIRASRLNVLDAIAYE